MFGGKRSISHAVKIIRSSLPMKRAKTATQHLLIPPDIPIVTLFRVRYEGCFEITCII